MIPDFMSFDQLSVFSKCLTDNADGTFTLATSVGSGTGAAYSSNKRRTTYEAFDHSIASNKVRTF